MSNKRFYQVLSLALAGLCLIALGAAQAQGQARARALIVGGKDMSHKADGMEVKVQKMVSGQWKLVGPEESFRAGDQVNVSFWANRGGYVYFINIAPNGKSKVLYRKQIEMNKDYELPDSGKYFEFDQEKGIEILKVYLSAAPNQVFEDALTKNGGILGDNVLNVSKELSQKGANTPPQKIQLVAIAQDGCGQRGMSLCRSRSLGFEPQNPKTNTGAVAIAQPEKTGDGKPTQRLGKDDAIVLEIRLNHL
jgi:hypothetical protein